MKKLKLVNFRVTEAQFHDLHSQAAQANMTVGEYVRRKVLDDPTIAALDQRITRLEQLAATTHVSVRAMSPTELQPAEEPFRR